MFSFTGQLKDFTVGGTAVGFLVRDLDGKRALTMTVVVKDGNDDLTYVTGHWTIRTYGVVALEVDLDAENGA
jgi:hypothetical protein